MNVIDNNIILDFTVNRSPLVNIHKNEDISRKIIIHPTNNGLLYTLSATAVATINISKADGKITIKDSVINTIDNTISFFVDENISSVAGKSTCDISILDENGLLKSSTFIINVLDSAISNDEIESVYEFDALDNFMKASQRANIAANDCKTQTNLSKDQTELCKTETQKCTNATFDCTASTNTCNSATASCEKATVNCNTVITNATEKINDCNTATEKCVAETTKAEKQTEECKTVTEVCKLQTSECESITEKLKNWNDTTSTINLHLIPRINPKDITAYYTDGSLWKRLNGTDGYSFLEDLYIGDYFKMSRPITCPNSANNTVGSQYVTIISFNGLKRNGDQDLNYNHMVCVPGAGFGGTNHFGIHQMNATNSTVGGYKASEMNTAVLGAVVSAGSTASGATINQQLYAEFGSHLKTTRELVSNSINATGYNRFGTNNGCSNNWEWISAQSILMSEVEVYGSIVWSSSGWDTGNANHQFELFANSKEAINNRSSWYWLKDIASATDFCHCNSNGAAGCSGASDASSYVRPRFVLA